MACTRRYAKYPNSAIIAKHTNTNGTFMAS
jgi:hypothetical protein